jgi:nucleoid DNA-binding protein
LSRQKIIAKLKEKNPQINKKILTNVLDSFFKSISNSLTRGKSVEIRSFGSFFIKQISEKKRARNPKTGEIIYVPKRNKIRFMASKRLKELINK